MEATVYTKNALSLNQDLTDRVLNALYEVGVEEFCVCPSSRNNHFVSNLLKNPHVKKHYWFEERSGAFFALGRSRATAKPVAVIVTSGTAAVELFPAVMTAYYKGVPLIVVTADRPRRFRGVGAPQSAEQLNLFGQYTPVCLDLEGEEEFNLQGWDKKIPLHLNVCFEDRLAKEVNIREKQNWSLPSFLEKAKKPFVIVSTLRPEIKEIVIQFLLKLHAPVYLEGISGLREEPRLESIRIANSEKILEISQKSGYEIDGILRIGDVPTLRFWRDIEEMTTDIPICNLSELPFSGLSWADVNCGPLDQLLNVKPNRVQDASRWIDQDRKEREVWLRHFETHPRAEPSLIHHLSKLIPPYSHVYLGNSLPIREWDFAAIRENRHFEMTASRGVNGIDGQISTFLGLCKPGISNWAILGDLTTLYDLAGPWIMSQLEDMDITLVVINNGGGKIFEKMFKEPEFLNSHNLTFEHFAKMWGFSYERWAQIPREIKGKSPRLIEIIPECL